MALEEQEIRQAVRDRYARLATKGASESCCDISESCCAPALDQNDIPTEATAVGAGCGAPLDELNLTAGQVVVDLGSGGGLDAFRASKLVGPSGQVIGIDSTPEMIWRARETAKTHGYGNVEFRLGEIEHLPVESNSVDAVISNCVINLVPDKRVAFSEAHRILRTGGTLAVSDITTSRKIPTILRRSIDAWSACLSGALTEEEYLQAIERAGFGEIQVRKRVPFIGKKLGFDWFMSMTITAKKS